MSRPRARRWRRPAAGSLLLLAALAGGPAPASAHSLDLTRATVELARDGSFTAELTVDLDALALGASPATPSEELAAALEGLSPAELEAAAERARQTLLRRVRVRFDGEPAPVELEFPERAPSRRIRLGEPTVLGLTARFRGRVPEAAGELGFFASRALGPVYLTVRDEATGRVEELPLAPGEPSPPFALGVAAGEGGGRSRVAVFGRYLRLGVEHIVPRGADHILFVLGLFLIARRLGPLLVQVSAFTVAHTASLALAIFGVVSLPPAWVEPLIALSIVWVAVENVVTREMAPWRPLVVFVFGLLHGLGFAGVLLDLGLPRGRFVTALVGFNVGVEIGQLAVVAAAMLAVGWARRRESYRRRVVVPLSLLIAAVGAFWFVERVF